MVRRQVFTLSTRVRFLVKAVYKRLLYGVFLTNLYKQKKLVMGQKFSKKLRAGSDGVRAYELSYHFRNLAAKKRHTTDSLVWLGFRHTALTSIKNPKREVPRLFALYTFNLLREG